MRRGPAAVAVLVAAVGCGGADGPAVVIEGTPPATPYHGPLDIAAKEADGSTPQAMRTASGAAGRALECDGEIYWGGGPDGWSGSDGGDSPEDGLRLFFRMFDPEVPRNGYRVERREADRVLYSYDVGGRTKVAVVVAEDQPGRPGWGPETGAACDPSELPASVTTGAGWPEIWTDADGRRMPVSKITSSAGAAHCDWQSAHFLTFGGRTYVRDPHGVFADDVLAGRYDGDTALPADAHDTGYRFRDWRLWLTDDGDTAYVRTSHGVEAWPQERRGFACD
ncbi:hypothetical protein ACIRQQ_13365 [Streptomyces fuscichromogenes]|uniref:hypothetical protein n=1 Tax=Streptomyces fuscichromogenes TaxID=1324013 RepID=UPI0037FB7AD7